MISPIVEDLFTEGYVLLSHMLKDEECMLIENTLNEAREGTHTTFPMNLNDSDDEGNVVYKSKRSPMNYCYLKTDKIMDLSNKIMDKLSELTEMVQGFEAAILAIQEDLVGLFM